jgi:hypothetical protein
VADIGRTEIRSFVAKAYKKSPLGKPGTVWENNIKMDFREIKTDGVDWIRLVQDTEKWGILVATVMGFEHLKIEATCSFETSGTTYPATQGHIPDTWNPRQ